MAPESTARTRVRDVPRWAAPGIPEQIEQEGRTRWTNSVTNGRAPTQVGVIIGRESGRAVILQPGDELRVDRGAYHHHALYVGGGGVVHFGGQIKDKRHAAIHYASVAEFAKGAQIRVVEHDELDRAAAVRRAQWLLDNPPPTTYNLLGYNCEHVARWCATGNIECRQAKSAFTMNSFMGAGLFAYFYEHATGWIMGVLQLLIGLLLLWLSSGPTRKFEQHIRENWQE